MGGCFSKQAVQQPTHERRPSIARDPTNAVLDSGAEPRFISSDETLSATLGNLKIRYGYMSQRGYYPDDEMKPNQDCYSTTLDFTDSPTDALFAVYDGHGRDGDKCAQFSRDHLPNLISRHIKKLKREMSINTEGELETVELNKEMTQSACATAHKQCNLAMHASRNLDDALSGTTAISCYIHGRRNRVTVCNVGDSRAVLGQRVRRNEGGSSGENQYHALPLSRDQTPYRRDERKRISSYGARILSLDQIEGLEPVADENDEDDDNTNDLELGKEIDEGGDPPRVWHPDQDYPGTAFTRSLGDSLAEELGVFAEPEMVTRELESGDEIIVLASDGVFEFLTNQSVIDICAKFKDPLAACRAVIAESYELWLQYELRTDDITMICMFIDSAASDASNTSVAHVPTDNGSNADAPDLVAPQRESRPVRSHPTVEKSKFVKKMSSLMLVVDNDEEDVDLSTLFTEKTPEEQAIISQAIKASVMLRSMTDDQRDLIYGVMEPIDVQKGDMVIKQGSVGDRFYIVEEGEFEVRILPDGQADKDNKGGNVVHMYQGSKEKHLHPSFGELALLYSAPRAASIIATKNGKLWALHKSALKKVLVGQSSRKELLRILGTVGMFKEFEKEELEYFAGTMKQETFGTGHEITRTKAVGNTMYVIKQGSCEISYFHLNEKKVKALYAGEYFGQEVMKSDKGKYFATTVTTSKTTCWILERSELKKLKGIKESSG